MSSNYNEFKEIRDFYDDITKASQLIETEIDYIGLNQCQIETKFCSSIHEEYFEKGLNDGFNLYKNIFDNYYESFEKDKELEKGDKIIFRCLEKVGIENNLSK